MASPVLHSARAAPSSGMAPAVLRFSDGVAAASGAFATLCLVALLLLILAEVGAGLLGKLFPGFGDEITVAWEYGAYLMGAVFLFGAAAGLRAGTHVRVSILLARAGRGFTLVLELVATLIGLFVTGFLAWALVQFALRAWSSGRLSSGSLTPLWIPDAVLALGAILLALQMATRLLRVLLGLPTEDESLKAGSLGE